MCNPLNNTACIQFSDTRKMISLEERKGRKYKGNNSSRKTITNYILDGCLSSDNNVKKADFVFVTCEDKQAYFVELKGADINQACKQLLHSIDSFSPLLNDYEKIFARIVLSKTPSPRLHGSNVLKLKKKLISLGGNLIYKTKLIDEKI